LIYSQLFLALYDHIIIYYLIAEVLQILQKKKIFDRTFWPYSKSRTRFDKFIAFTLDAFNGYSEREKENKSKIDDWLRIIIVLKKQYYLLSQQLDTF